MSEVFCRQTVRVLTDNPDMPSSLDVAGAQADLAALDRPRPVFERLGRLHSLLDDASSALGNDIQSPEATFKVAKPDPRRSLASAIRTPT